MSIVFVQKMSNPVGRLAVLFEKGSRLLIDIEATNPVLAKIFLERTAVGCSLVYASDFLSILKIAFSIDRATATLAPFPYTLLGPLRVK